MRLCTQRGLIAGALILPVLVGQRDAVAQRPIFQNSNDFYIKGTQPGRLAQMNAESIVTPDQCSVCHVSNIATPSANFHYDWSGNMMAHAMRDPLFRAAMQVANGDVQGAGELCMRCHTPKGFLEGRATPADGSALDYEDFHGVSCNFCHRMVANSASGNECDISGSTCIDADIREELLIAGDLPNQYGSGGFVVDPLDRRRGPFADAVCDSYHTKEVRDLFVQSAVCGTCHDVSNPVFMKSGSDYVPTPANQKHPTGNKYDMFPVERTYSEWLHSSYAQVGGVNSGGRFGGNNPVVDNCQSCHMPRGLGDQVPLQACFVFGVPARLDIPMHRFLGSNTWVQDLLINLYPNDVDPAALTDGKLRNLAFLGNAATLQLTLDGGQAKVRVINECGHKLPTGYVEGRRMWLRVIVKDCFGGTLAEYGHYDNATGDLNTNTKVYESHTGMDATMAGVSGLPAGPGFHFALNNKVFFDNRIPPRGFTNAAFASAQAAPVGYSYADGQHWDDTTFALPSGAASVQAELYYQTASKEYIEFLRDNNPLPVNDPENFGQIVHSQWQITGRSPPVLMANQSLNLLLLGDLNGDQSITAADVPIFVNVLLGNDTSPAHVCPADVNNDGNADGMDIQPFIDLLLI